LYPLFRLAKERKKADKVVVDSQEKAFWRIHRPGVRFTPCFFAICHNILSKKKVSSFIELPK
jgi:hypothetical protein